MTRNYLDLVPVINEKNRWELTKEKMVVVFIENKGFYNKMAQKYFSRPKISEVELDGYGSYVWQKIDGKRTIADISQDIMKDYGEEENLAIKRLVMFFEMLKNHKIINLTIC